MLKQLSKIVFCLALVVITIILAIIKPDVSIAQPDLNVIMGEWVRSDGSYIVHVRKVMPDGSVDVAYLNPAEIHISDAAVSYWKGLVKLYIRLQDECYPGSTYTLYYYAQKDSLAGFYYQAAIGRTFEVVFKRRSEQ